MRVFPCILKTLWSQKHWLFFSSKIHLRWSCSCLRLVFFLVGSSAFSRQQDTKACQYKPYNTCDDSRLRDPKTACEEGSISAFPVLEALIVLHVFTFSLWACNPKQFTKAYLLQWYDNAYISFVSLAKKKRCLLVTKTPTEKQHVGQLIITFGIFDSKSYKWLVENDVGCIK